MTTIVLGAVTCLLAIGMAVLSGFALWRAERQGHQGQAYVLPVFVGLAYVVLTALELHDAALDSDRRIVVQVVSQLLQTMLILSVILMVHRLRRRGD
jgi:hypothetical protein